MIRLTAARIAVFGAGFATALGGAVAATVAAGAPAMATLTAAQPSPTPSGTHSDPAKKRIDLDLRLRHALVKETAKATGESVADVRAQLRAGKSLDDIAGSKSADVKAAVLQDVRAVVEKAVDAKKITQAQADAIVDRATARIDRIMAAHRTPKAVPSPSSAG